MSAKCLLRTIGPKHNCSQLLTRRALRQTCESLRQHNFDGETYSKTNMILLTKEDQTHTYVEAFSSYGFRLTSGFRILGPCVLLPKAILHWNVTSAEMISPESLSLFSILEPKLDILLIGKGDWNATVNKDVIRYLRSKKINVEILSTEQACATFNFLNSERRIVAAGLIPPNYMEESESFMLDNDHIISLSEKGSDAVDEEGSIKSTMEMFKEKGIMDTLRETEKEHRVRSSGTYSPKDLSYGVEKKDKEKS